MSQKTKIHMLVGIATSSMTVLALYFISWAKPSEMLIAPAVIASIALAVMGLTKYFKHRAFFSLEHLTSFLLIAFTVLVYLAGMLLEHVGGVGGYALLMLFSLGLPCSTVILVAYMTYQTVVEWFDDPNDCLPNL